MTPILSLQPKSCMPFLLRKSICQSRDVHRSNQYPLGWCWSTSHTFVLLMLKNSWVLHHAYDLAVKGPKFVPEVQKYADLWAKSIWKHPKFTLLRSKLYIAENTSVVVEETLYFCKCLQRQQLGAILCTFSKPFRKIELVACKYSQLNDN
jgi:hypothetical protein